ncbi:hypothetical protein ACFQWF_12595 [Methylorubrum suomiense]
MPASSAATIPALGPFEAALAEMATPCSCSTRAGPSPSPMITPQSCSRAPSRWVPASPLCSPRPRWGRIAVPNGWGGAP